MPLSAGSRLGPYEIVGRLGAGGMGVVYRARDPRLGRDVAIKVLLDEVAADPERLHRFEREARAAGALNHPNVLAVYDVGHESGAPFVVTELLEGETLRERLRAGALAPRKALDLAIQIAHGLAAAHARGIVHRDLKPENLFVTRDGRAKILDFGLAKMRPAAAPDAATAAETSPGTILGTIAYLSPEQARGQDADARSDIFAFGAVLYEMLAGRAAFGGASTADVLSAILREDPPALPAGTPAGFERIVHRCLEKDPAERFASARDLGFALEASGAEPPAPKARSVAVLPFKDLARGADSAHIGIGLADATVTELARVRAVHVRPTAAILRYQDRPVDPHEAARELSVDAVVDGSFQRAGDKLRVTVQLVSADGRSLWATKIDASLADVFEMQDEVSRQIVQALQRELTRDMPLTMSDTMAIAISSEAKSPAPGDQAAYGRTLASRLGSLFRGRPHKEARGAPDRALELYFRGRLCLFRGRLAEVNQAIDAFEQARDADPDFAPAWAGLADAYARMAFEHAPQGDWYQRAQEMCARALAIDPALPEGRYLRGRLAWTPVAGFDHATAMREAGAALAANPALTAARYLLGLVLFHVGLIDDAEAQFAEALAADPDDPYAHMHIATCRLHQGRFAEALTLAESSYERFPDRWSLSNIGLSLQRLGRLDEAERIVERLARENPDYPHAHSLGASLAALRGDAAQARRVIARIGEGRQDYGHFHHAEYDVACTLAVLGDGDAAMDWLRRAAANGYPCPDFFASDPLLDSLRGRGDYREFMTGLEASRERYRQIYLGN